MDDPEDAEEDSDELAPVGDAADDLVGNVGGSAPSDGDDALDDGLDDGPPRLRRGHLVVVAMLLLVGIVGAVVMVVQQRPVSEPLPHPTVAVGADRSGRPGRPTSASRAADPGSTADARTVPSAAPSILVHVAGKVARPGVIRLPAGARAVDALESAGGAERGVDLSTVNLARVLTDGEQLLIGVVPTVPPPPAGVDPRRDPRGGAAATPGPIDLNHATLDQLVELPGVGPVLAQRILDFRTAQGRFTSVDELAEVTGIGERRLAELRPRVTVR